ncbi:MAG TPA: hypothetical protein VK421_06310 [Pyrinomonadaceae bacterium]|nr:hypothetical protein [Pyrinomonadaceae bacterium]
MNWRRIHRAHRAGRELADRHYSRQKPGTPQFVKPGSCLVLHAPGPALWVTSAPYARFVRHEWAGAWECSTFRNEGRLPSSDLIVEAVAATRAHYGEPPALGMITFVDPQRVAGFFVRTPRGRELRWGYSFWKAGFVFCGWTRGLKYALRLAPEAMPLPRQAVGSQLRLLEAVT